MQVMENFCKQIHCGMIDFCRAIGCDFLLRPGASYDEICITIIEIKSKTRGWYEKNTLCHDQKQIEKIVGMNCALYFTKLNHYTKEMLLSEGIQKILWNDEHAVYKGYPGRQAV